MQYFDIIIFAILAGYLGIKLYRTLGVKTKIETKTSTNKPSHSNTDEIDSETLVAKEDIKKDISQGQGVDYLKQIDKNFNEKQFLIGANKAYEIMTQAKNTGNKKLLISMLEDNVFRVFEKEILDREMKGNFIETTKVEVNKSEIIDAKVDNNIAYITVAFNVNIGTLVRASDSSVISDSLKKLVTYSNNWIFCRSLDSDNPNWKLDSI